MDKLILGEAVRTLDERYRISIPPELMDLLDAASGQCILAKERPGCLSLWNANRWQDRLSGEIGLIEQKVVARRLDARLDEVQRLGRLLSTRHRPVQLAGRGRLVLPEGFREFLSVEPGATIIITGAAVCIELWHPMQWQQHIGEEMPTFRRLLDTLVG